MEDGNILKRGQRRRGCILSGYIQRIHADNELRIRKVARQLQSDRLSGCGHRREIWLLFQSFGRRRKNSKDRELYNQLLIKKQGGGGMDESTNLILIDAPYAGDICRRSCRQAHRCLEYSSVTLSRSHSIDFN